MMNLGMIGLGRMGSNMARRLMRGGHTCVVYDRNPAPGQELSGAGAKSAKSVDELVAGLEKPRTVWMMLPAGGITEDMVKTLAGKLERGDVIIDGGNSYYKDDIRRGKLVAEQGIDYVDAGTSGGVWGLERGYCLMVGAKEEVFDRLTPIFRTLAPGVGSIALTPGRKKTTADEGFIHAGPTGAGHFVKMVHNGIEYGLMQSYAEGFDIFKNANSQELPEDRRFDL